MKTLFLALPAAMLLAAPATSGTAPDLTEKQQTELDKRLDGRSAGAARSCISANDQRQMTVISDDILLFGSRRNAKTIYVNKPYAGCRNADRSILSYSRPMSSLCRGDTIQLIDSTTRMAMGSCAFGEFVPYTRNAD